MFRVAQESRCTLFLMLVGLPLDDCALVHVQTGPSQLSKIVKISWEKKNNQSCTVWVAKLIIGKEE